MSNGKDGSHPPGNAFQVTCIGKTGLTVSFSGETASIDVTFTKQEDADYFQVETFYVVDFSLARSGDSSGGDQQPSQPSS